MKIAVIGLGYVGLPVALAFSKKYPDTIGFDIDETRVRELNDGLDSTGEISREELHTSGLTCTTTTTDLSGADIFIVAVPTPVDDNHSPDLRALEASSITVGSALKRGSIVVFESTVYPGVTEEFCGPIIERTSKMKSGVDFFLGYSPERINPGDKEHTIEKIVKVISAQNDQALEVLAEVYGAIVEAGVHRAPSIKVAEAAKVIENTQRDLNIALMNELSLIFDMMDIRTSDVLEAAGTKWNFIPFKPGLVGGHCIGVDPYYLTTAAERLGYHPQVILAGRRINDQMGKFVAQRAIKLMVQRDVSASSAAVGVFGITFKENIPDTRNSRVPSIVRELEAFGCTPYVCDPHACPKEIAKYHNIDLVSFEEIPPLDVAIFAVAHEVFLEKKAEFLSSKLSAQGILIDVKSVFLPDDITDAQLYWSL